VAVTTLNIRDHGLLLDNSYDPGPLSLFAGKYYFPQNQGTPKRGSALAARSNEKKKQEKDL
jgi:hypothetical protein